MGRKGYKKTVSEGYEPCYKLVYQKLRILVYTEPSATPGTAGCLQMMVLPMQLATALVDQLWKWKIGSGGESNWDTTASALR